MNIQEEAAFAERRRKIEAKLQRDLNRAMLPIMLPMTTSAGALLGLLVAILILPPLPQPFIGWFMLLAFLVAAAPIAYLMIKYR